MGKKIMKRKKSVRQLNTERRRGCVRDVYEATEDLVPKFVGVFDALRKTGVDPRAAAISALVTCLGTIQRANFRTEGHA